METGFFPNLYVMKVNFLTSDRNIQTVFWHFLCALLPKVGTFEGDFEFPSVSSKICEKKIANFSIIIFFSYFRIFSISKALPFEFYRF